MEKYLNEEQVNTLKNRGLSLKSIKEIKELLKWYYKKANNMQLSITGDSILGLNNLKEIMDERTVYGINGVGILRELTLEEIDRENPSYIYKDLFYQTIRNAAPDYFEIGGTQYYRVFLKEGFLKIYCLDNFFRLVETKEFPIEKIEGCCLRNSIKFEGQNLKIYHMIIKVEEETTNGVLYMYSTKRMNESRMPELYKLLKEKNVAEYKTNKRQERAADRIAVYCVIVFMVVLFVGVIARTLPSIISAFHR